MGNISIIVYSISKDNQNLILDGTRTSIELTKDNISNYEIKNIEYRRNIIDIVARIIIGTMLVGLLAGFTASNTFISYYLVSIEFKDGKKSLIKMDKKKFKDLSETIF